MKIQFNDRLDYQLDALHAVCNLFKGQGRSSTSFSLQPTQGQQELLGTSGVSNHLDLGPDQLLQNLHEVQYQNGLPLSETLEELDFSVEMETGTGKTYVYLRSIYELNQRYGLTKFIVVVPSVAIREGTLKSLRITQKHFSELYQNTCCEFFSYDSDKLEQIRQFATSNHIQVMVINIDAFRRSFVDPDKESKANRIHRPHDQLNGRKPIDFIAGTQPVLIIDEPQSVDSTPRAREAIASLAPLVTFRYSATHKDLHHPIFKLDAIDAYQRRLVKQIEVASFEVQNDHNQAYIRLLQVDNKKGYRAQIELDVLKKGKLVRQKKWVTPNTDLSELSRRDTYRGYIVKDIGFAPGREYLDFTSKPDILRPGNAIGSVPDLELKRLQIRKTIEEHLEKELVLLPRGIKVLSLFFIDKVANYRQYSASGTPEPGPYAQIFEQEYRKLIQHPRFDPLFENHRNRSEPVPDIHDGYFSIDNRRRADRAGERFAAYTDSTGRSRKDADTFNLIMRDKERLLSLDTPLRFIFSHSALKEGWDNPNVFQICTLNETRSEDKKRQEIGRGLRICVDQTGQRVHDPGINVLTVVANESYEDFVGALQKEMENDLGIRFGRVEAHSFAHLPIYGNEETAQHLGSEASRQLYEHLRAHNFLDQEGQVTPELRDALFQEKLELPVEFEMVREPLTRSLLRICSQLRVRDARKKKRISLNKERFLSAEFREIWERIRYRSTYSVQFDPEKLQQGCAQAIRDELKVTDGRLLYRKATADIHRAGVDIREGSVSEEVHLLDQSAATIPDLLGHIQNATHLTRKSIANILVGSQRLPEVLRNPQRFLEQVVEIIQRQMRHFIIDDIKYTRAEDGQHYTQELFEKHELFGHLSQNLVPSTRSPYEYTVYDSEVERLFVQQLEASQEVRMYLKLPSWFQIDTPLGKYNPDWAILWEQDQSSRLYFIVETKGKINWEDLRPVEQGKIKCGQKHFDATAHGVCLEVASKVDHLREKASPGQRAAG